MTITIKIEEIDNGFIITCFDNRPLTEHDVTEYRKTFNDALKVIQTWYEATQPIDKKRDVLNTT